MALVTADFWFQVNVKAMEFMPSIAVQIWE